MFVCLYSYADTVVGLLASPSFSSCSLTEENTFFLRRKLAGNTGTKLPADLANRQKIIIFPNPAEFPLIVIRGAFGLLFHAQYIYLGMIEPNFFSLSQVSGRGGTSVVSVEIHVTRFIRRHCSCRPEIDSTVCVLWGAG
jgi:hypothetical protein